MVIHVLAVGKLRDQVIREACAEYLARARRYFRIETREVVPRGRTSEGSALLAAVPRGATTVGLTRGGLADDSARFARRAAGWQRSGRDVALLVGGASGLGEAVLARCDARLSLSPLTLPHELARLVLLEQLYRAGTILKGEPYHKGAG